ncbi:hypothetical protein [Humisphaera borealis]|uniref:Uncharacterized protein n=1 Tax=Humisphaera borealis TaxID=2807512 RepID=A0A7M2WQC2_9BACT|nr:hypothetical protein [Humisphaera borealis]QOV87646.1 hypothetical protein IPV69_15270 [Humisphaera borealis]
MPLMTIADVRNELALKSRQRWGTLWTVHQVATFLNCSDDKARAWLRDKGVALIDLGKGRSMLRVDPADVRRAIEASAVPLEVAAERARPIKYVPKYIRPARPGYLGAPDRSAADTTTAGASAKTAGGPTKASSNN